MGYSIRYGQIAAERRRAPLPFCILAAALGMLAWYELRRCGAFQALEALARAIGGGVPVQDAFGDFCRGLFENV